MDEKHGKYIESLNKMIPIMKILGGSLLIIPLLVQFYLASNTKKKIERIFPSLIQINNENIANQSVLDGLENKLRTNYEKQLYEMSSMYIKAYPLVAYMSTLNYFRMIMIMLQISGGIILSYSYLIDCTIKVVKEE
ncbi:MAG: hypothetical protein ABIJ41_07555 [Candidatus Omnitrophota bacterium]